MEPSGALGVIEVKSLGTCLEEINNGDIPGSPCLEGLLLPFLLSLLSGSNEISSLCHYMLLPMRHYATRSPKDCGQVIMDWTSQTVSQNLSFLFLVIEIWLTHWSCWKQGWEQPCRSAHNSQFFLLLDRWLAPIQEGQLGWYSKELSQGKQEHLPGQFAFSVSPAPRVSMFL